MGSRSSATSFLRLVPLLLAAASGCSTATQPANRYERVVGFLDPGFSRPLILPDTARADATVTATVTTTGNGCVKPDGATATLGVAGADITPYDLVPVDGVCIDNIQAFPRPVPLQFLAPGVVMVTLHERGPTGPISVTRSLVVRP